MGSYVPSTEEERKEMLKALGLSNEMELYASVPQSMILKNGPDIPEGMSELEVGRAVSDIAEKNIRYNTNLVTFSFKTVHPNF